MKKTHTCTSLVCWSDLHRGCWKVCEPADCDTKQEKGFFFLFKKGPPTFQCNETPPIPQTLLIHIYSILMLIYTLSWCMKHLYSTLCCEATKRLHQLNESQVVLLTQHLGIRATQHSHRRAERVLDKLVGCLLTQRHDSFN